MKLQEASHVFCCYSTSPLRCSVCHNPIAKQLVIVFLHTNTLSCPQLACRVTYLVGWPFFILTFKVLTDVYLSPLKSQVTIMLIFAVVDFKIFDLPEENMVNRTHQTAQSSVSTITCSSAMSTGRDLRLDTIRYSAATGKSSTRTTGNRLIIARLSSEILYYIIALEWKG